MVPALSYFLRLLESPCNRYKKLHSSQESCFLSRWFQLFNAACNYFNLLAADFKKFYLLQDSWFFSKRLQLFIYSPMFWNYFSMWLVVLSRYIKLHFAHNFDGYHNVWCPLQCFESTLRLLFHVKIHMMRKVCPHVSRWSGWKYGNYISSLIYSTQIIWAECRKENNLTQTLLE